MRNAVKADATMKLTVAYHHNQKTKDVANVLMGRKHSNYRARLRATI
jgi:hypothetical protein